MGKKPGSSKDVLRWETLDRDILAIIFHKLDVMDLTKGVSRVWFLASQDKNSVANRRPRQAPTSGRLVQARDEGQSTASCLVQSPGGRWSRSRRRREGLSILKLLVKSFFNLYSRMQGGQVEKGRTSLKKLLTEITKLSSTVPKNLMFNSSSYIDEKDLMFVAQR